MPDGQTYSPPTLPPLGHPRLQKPIHDERHVKIVCVGAGASGLLLAYKLQRSFENYDLVVYEKNAEVAGTWYENRYPGCACDIPAHTYTYSFEPNPAWSSVYAGSREIFQYFDSFCDKYALRKHIKVKQQVSKARWDDARAKWDLEIVNLADGSTIQDSCDILVNASGVLNSWKWPKIRGLESYKGKLIHTANWDPNVDLHGKSVGLIGNGSSGIQVLPAILPEAGSITAFIRSPTWVAPQLLPQHVYSEEERRVFETDPNALLRHRGELETMTNSLFSIFLSDSPAQKKLSGDLAALMKSKIGDEVLEKLLIPTFPLGCRRITPGVGYLEALKSDKVKLVYGEIQEITERGCISDDGRECPVDVLICATGFDTTFKPRFPLIGADKRTMSECWEKEATSYLGLAVPNFPNYFCFAGPNSPTGTGTFLIALEAQADYMLKMIDRWQTENIHSFSPKMNAVEDFVAYKDNFMKGTVWTHECNSWYKSNSISESITAIWPGSSLHYLEAMAEPRYEDWDLKYSGNRFAFFGNGFSQTEVDQTADWAYYLRNSDDSPFLSRGKRRKFYSKSGTVTRGGSAIPIPRGNL